ncbi:gliding motility-associated C-terminal domain-containing protein [uncultured Flavobacterium sp.]|uniref:T9SS type B sorting domain-containing protein n=1 Tax=uncultured Flavobacterium sp. TaxID=165435 RepID=UPI0025953147|nr:gliding motility-associated C-terminal domain-containing protein [uncultured Flavobacterium sp.]
MRKLYLLLLVAVSAIQLSYAQNPPIISYNENNVFTVGSDIVILKPSNSGGSITGVEVTTFAGNGTTGSQNGTGNQASFNVPQGMAIDALGNIFIVDVYNHLIRKITPQGNVSTFAGSGNPGSQNGTGINASFNNPIDIAIDASGNLFISDSGNHKIRKITPTGVVSTFAGSGVKKFEDGNGTDASFNIPFGLVFDSMQNLFVVDSFNNRIRKITPSGVVTTIAGNGNIGSADGNGNNSNFNFPQGITIDDHDNLFIADVYNNKIRKISPSEVVTTYAGTGVAGMKDGDIKDSSFDGPADVSFDSFKNLIIADLNNNIIRKITPLGAVTTIAGNGQKGDFDGTATNATFNAPTAIVINVSGEIFITTRSNTIRKILNKNGSFSISPALPNGMHFNNNNGEISGKAISLQPKTSYTVNATNEYGLSSFNLTIEITDTAPNITYTTPNVFDQDKTINPLQVTNTGGKVLNFIINPSLPSGLNFNTITGEISGTPTESIKSSIFTVIATNSGGSSYFDIDIKILESVKPDSKILIAEAVTPNGDGINDFWVIKNIENYTNSVVRVYNRWGAEVFSAKNYQNDWDGHFKDNSQSLPDSSSYLYQIDLENDGVIDYQGWIYITK